MLEDTYQLGLTGSYPIPIDYKIGILGGSTRVAWENGYLGINRKYQKNSRAYAAWCAGKKVKETELENEKKLKQ